MYSTLPRQQHINENQSAWAEAVRMEGDGNCQVIMKASQERERRVQPKVVSVLLEAHWWKATHTHTYMCMEVAPSRVMFSIHKNKKLRSRSLTRRNPFLFVVYNLPPAVQFGVKFLIQKKKATDHAHQQLIWVVNRKSLPCVIRRRKEREKNIKPAVQVAVWK